MAFNRRSFFSFLTRRPGQRARLFISYRRRSDWRIARLLQERLNDAFGSRAVFRDVDDIKPGDTFPLSIQRAIETCAALILIISPEWIESAGKLHDPRDFVRREIAVALGRQLPLIPVLVGGARMPKEDDLPADIRGLAFIQALELSDSRWDYDVRRLVEAVRARVDPPVLAASSAPRLFLGTRPGKVLAAVAAVAAVALAAGLALKYMLRYELFYRNFDACVGTHSPDMPGAVARLRLDSKDSPVLTADQYASALNRRDGSEGIPLVLRLSDPERELGMVVLRFFKADKVEDSVFKVDKVVEPPCEDVRNYFNSSLPAADRRVLKNWNRLAVRLGGRDYLVRPDDRGGYVVATLTLAPTDLQVPWQKK
jgi:hypothetical protein